MTHYEKRAGDSRKTPSWIWRNSGYVKGIPEGPMKDFVEESTSAVALVT